MDLPVAVRERRGLPEKGDHAFLAEQIKRILVPIQYLHSYTQKSIPDQLR